MKHRGLGWGSTPPLAPDARGGSQPTERETVLPFKGKEAPLSKFKGRAQDMGLVCSCMDGQPANMKSSPPCGKQGAEGAAEGVAGSWRLLFAPGTAELSAKEHKQAETKSRYP